MKMKSPCIDHCKLNEKKTQCVGCLRTVEEITEWNSYCNNKKKKNIQIIKTKEVWYFFFY